MAQSPYRINLESGSVGILQDILSLIASETEFEPVAQSLLVAMQELTGADAAYFVLLESPHTRLVANLDIEALPEDDFFASMVDSLASAIHLTSQLPSPMDEHYHGAMVSPIRIKRTNVAVFTLLFADGVQINDENTAVLEALLNGLKIITQHMLSRSRQDRIMRNQNEFVRIVSHDLRSPLTSMQGFGSMLLSEVVGDLNEKQSHFVDKILSGITQMTALVDNIQDAGRYDPETGFYEMQRTPTDLVAIVQRILDSYILPAEKDTLSVNFNPADDLPIVNVDGNM
jgi:signal transduction histidine kinase